MRFAIALLALCLLNGCAGMTEIRAPCACFEKPINPALPLGSAIL